MPPRKRKEAVEPVRDTTDDGEMSTRLNSSKKDVYFIVIVVVVVLAAVGLMIANAVKGKKPAETIGADQPAQVQDVGTQNPKIAIGKEDIQGLINRVGELIVIKAGEQPTVATIQDANLAKQSNPLFYKDAENGDRLLVWTDKAVLYSTAKDKLLAVIPINPGEGAPSADGTPAQATSTQAAAGATVQTENAQIVVLNGTTKAGLAKSMSNILKSGGLTVVKATDAALKDYTKNVIVNVSGKELPETMKALGTLISAEVVSAPVGETRLGGDITVIVGVAE